MHEDILKSGDLEVLHACPKAFLTQLTRDILIAIRKRMPLAEFHRSSKESFMQDDPYRSIGLLFRPRKSAIDVIFWENPDNPSDLSALQSNAPSLNIATRDYNDTCWGRIYHQNQIPELISAFRQSTKYHIIKHPELDMNSFWIDLPEDMIEQSLVLEQNIDEHIEPSSTERSFLVEEQYEKRQGRITIKVNGGDIERKKKEEVFRITGTLKCESCHTDWKKHFNLDSNAKRGFHADHIIPRSERRRLGITSLDSAKDLCILCAFCNSVKSDKMTLDELKDLMKSRRELIDNVNEHSQIIPAVCGQ
jgi:5-methylcytosine-specific restriction endonuclease McrA